MVQILIIITGLLLRGGGGTGKQLVLRSTLASLEIHKRHARAGLFTAVLEPGSRHWYLEFFRTTRGAPKVRFAEGILKTQVKRFKNYAVFYYDNIVGGRVGRGGWSVGGWVGGWAGGGVGGWAGWRGGGGTYADLPRICPPPLFSFKLNLFVHLVRNSR